MRTGSCSLAGFSLTVAVYPWQGAIPPEDVARYLAAG